MPTIENIKLNVTDIAKMYSIKKATLFGSYAEGTQTAESDIDLLVEFSEPSVSIFKLAEIMLKLQEVTGKNVDVVHAPIAEGSLIEINREVLLYECQG